MYQPNLEGRQYKIEKTIVSYEVIGEFVIRLELNSTFYRLVAADDWIC